MLLVGLSVLVSGRASTWDPELELGGERPALYCRLESLPGPQDRSRAAGGLSATLGQTLSLKSREKVLGDSTVLDIWFGSVQLICSDNPPPAVLPGHPSAHADREKAGKESGRLAFLGGIHWYGKGANPPDLRVRPIACDCRGR